MHELIRPAFAKLEVWNHYLVKLVTLPEPL